MNRLVRQLRQAGPSTRIAALAGVVVALGVTSSVLAGGAAEVPTYRPPGGLRSLLADGAGTVVVDRAGRPVAGPDGKPLRVGPDGRTLVDSRNRPLRDRRGRPLRITPGGRLPRAAHGLERVPERRPPRRRPRPGAPAPAPAPGESPAPPSGRGDPVVLGAYYTDPEQIATLAGQLLIDAKPGDTATQLRALERYVNETGGVRGRPLQIRTFVQPSRGTFDELAQQACQEFREAPRPLAVMTLAGRPKVMVPCLADGGTALFASFSSSPTRAFFEEWPNHLYAPSGVSIERLAELYVAALQRSGFLGRNARVGILTVETPWMPAGSAALKAALRRAGASVAAEYEIRGSSADDFLTLPRQGSEAVLRFRREGVSHVVGLDVAGIGLIVFLDAATSQAYFPRYGLNTTHAPNTVAHQRRFRAGQLRGALGVGWAPLLDVPASGASRSSRHDQCDRIYTGIDVGDRNLYGHYSAYLWCDTVFVIREALERGGGVSLDALRRGIDSLGSSFEVALNLRTRLDASRHDGTAGFRQLRYDDDCTCWRYVGPVFDD